MAKLISFLFLVGVFVAPIGIAQTETALLGRDEGYLLLDADVGLASRDWKLNKSFSVDSLPVGRTTKLIRLKAGRYQWQQISVPYFGLPSNLPLEDDPRWSFQIHPGKVNYAGTLVVGAERSRSNVYVRYLNRSAEVLSLVRQRFSSELDNYGLVYSGFGDDDFFPLVLHRAAP